MEDPLEKGKAVHSSILACTIPWILVYGVTKSRTQLKDLSLHFQELSPEFRLDWSLPVPSGVSSLKPAKTHTLAFTGSPLSTLDRKTSMVPHAHR